MAKVGGKVNSSNSDYVHIDRDIIPKGKHYEVETSFNESKLNCEMKVGYSIRECYDGFYSCFDDGGRKLFIRIGARALEPFLPNLKLKTE